MHFEKKQLNKGMVIKGSVFNTALINSMEFDAQNNTLIGIVEG
jgi:hypothetical protein